MKFMYCALCLSLLFIGCKDANDNKTMKEDDSKMSMNDVFKKNSETVMANLKGWQNENVDYSMYAKDFVMLETVFGVEKDSVNLNEMMDSDKMMLKNYDFKMVTDPVLLPGVNSDTKKMDGSVRYYSEWEVTRVATDSMPAKTGNLQVYESFDFDENGKIMMQQMYGDFTGLMMYLNSKDDMMKKDDMEMKKK
ncbi:MAG: hypothetical protein ABIO60_09250 [Aquaticitalea sp.]